MYVALVFFWSITKRRSCAISIPSMFEFEKDNVERIEVKFEFAFMILTELLVATKRRTPSVLTMSGSSTPLTWSLVPVKVGLDGDCVESVVAAAAKVADEVATPFAMGIPRNKPPPFTRLYCCALLAFAAMKLCICE